MPRTTTHSMLAEAISLFVGVIAIGYTVFAYLMHAGTLQIQGLYLDTNTLFTGAVLLLGLCGILLLISTLGAITHIFDRT